MPGAAPQPAAMHRRRWLRCGRRRSCAAPQAASRPSGSARRLTARRDLLRDLRLPGPRQVHDLRGSATADAAVRHGRRVILQAAAAAPRTRARALALHAYCSPVARSVASLTLEKAPVPMVTPSSYTSNTVASVRSLRPLLQRGRWRRPVGGGSGCGSGGSRPCVFQPARLLTLRPCQGSCGWSDKRRGCELRAVPGALTRDTLPCPP